MSDLNAKQTVLGRAELIDFPAHGLFGVPARVDTGAKTSSIWASQVKLSGGLLHVVLFGPGSQFYSGQVLTFDGFKKAVVSTSMGEIDERYKVRLSVRIGGRRVGAFFTLADRSTQVYPVLIGRNVLLGKFIVDVKKMLGRH